MIRKIRCFTYQAIPITIVVFSMIFTAWMPILAAGEPAKPCDKAKTVLRTEDYAHQCPDLALLDYHSAPVLPSSTGGPDQYGYTWDDSLAVQWKEVVSGPGVTPGTQIFPAPATPDTTVDDQVVGPIDIGFDFKFYENSYTHLYISSNGIIGFTPDFSGSLAGASNLSIPFDYYIPQNFLAPFWDDIIIGGNHNDGVVAYSRGSDARGDYIVVEWRQVSKTDLSGLLTFEAVLYESGDIVFQYLDLGGDLTSVTVGIEDSSGQDGLAYISNTAGLSSNKAVWFERPLPSARVKTIPLTQGGFNIMGKSTHQLVIRNTGDLGADVIDILVTGVAPGWQIVLLDAQGVMLKDHDGDSLQDTGPLGQNQDFPITVKVFAAENAKANTGVMVQIEARSSNNSAKKQTAQINSVIPAPFALTYRRGLQVFSELISPFQQSAAVEFEYYAGGTFGMANGPDNQFVGISLVSGGSLYTNLEYMLINSLGQTIFKIPELLTDNSAGLDVRDNAPVVVTAPNGNIGIAWVRRLTRLTDFRTNINIYFAILDPSGTNFIQPEVNITQNDVWANTEDPDLMELENIKMDVVADSASGQGRFHLAWIEKHTRNTGLITTDVVHAVYGDNGAVVKPATMFTSFLSDRIDYFEPALMALNENQALLLYFVSDTNDPLLIKDYIVYTRLDSSGAILKNETSLFDVVGEEIDAIQMSDGSIAMAWLNLDTSTINVAILTPDLSQIKSVVELPAPDGRSGQAISITRGLPGQAILTWMDGGLLERLYYAVIKSDGTLVVEPVTFKYRQGEPALETVGGQGNAEYSTHLANYLPIIRK